MDKKELLLKRQKADIRRMIHLSCPQLLPIVGLEASIKLSFFKAATVKFTVKSILVSQSTSSLTIMSGWSFVVLLIRTVLAIGKQLRHNDAMKSFVIFFFTFAVGAVLAAAGEITLSVKQTEGMK